MTTMTLTWWNGGRRIRLAAQRLTWRRRDLSEALTPEGRAFRALFLANIGWER